MNKFPLIAAAFAVACLFIANPASTAQDPAPKPDSPTADAMPVDYLIVSADGLAEVASEWAKYRADNGRVTKVLTLSQIGKLAEVNPPGLPEIKNAILLAAGSEALTSGFQVLLLGDCPNETATEYDIKTEIPWMLTTQMDSNPTPAMRNRVPTDNFYADLVKDDDGLPDIAIGRVPARTVEQARLALNKVKAYEAAAQGEWLRNLTFFAGEGRFGAAIDKMLESIFIRFAEKIAQAYAVRMTYANINSDYAYVPSKFSDKVIEEANSGAILLTYLGHGSYDRLDNMYVEAGGKRIRYPILTSADVEKFNIPDGKLPVMMIIACDTGYMDHAEGCLAEKICFTEKAPVAIVASSRNSHPYSNTLLQKEMVNQLTGVKPATLGQAFMDTKRELILAKDPDRKGLDLMTMLLMSATERAEINRSHLSMYNLTGDPGLRLQYPKLDVTLKAEPKGNNSIDLVVSGSQPFKDVEFECWIECKRASLAKELTAYDKAALVGDDAEKRAAAEKILTENHALANDKCMHRFKTSFDGTAETETRPEGGEPTRTYSVMLVGKLDSPLAPGDYILKVFARDSKGTRCGFAATELKIKK
jgi:hypothetical protein